MKKTLVIIAILALALHNTPAVCFGDGDAGYKKALLNKTEQPKRASDELIDAVAQELDIDFRTVDRKEFARGMMVELEHGTVNPATDITGDAPALTAKIVLAHLNELPDYYTLLDGMEERE